MSNNNLRPYKGARDFYPEDKRIQKWMFDKWRRVVEKYGYEEYDAPILEPTDLYLMKGSQEIVDEQTYTFKDRGDRSVTIRTEMTPTVSRMVAGRRQELAYPARWYSIPNLWRYERMQRGRLREFWQLNVDVFGLSGIDAELEMIQISDDLMQSFHAKRSQYTIKINSRVLVNTMLDRLALSHDKVQEIVRLVDKVNKMSAEQFAEKLDVITEDRSISGSIVNLLAVTKLEDLPAELQELKSVKDSYALLQSARAIGINNIVFDITLMRGFDYYTDIVFEVFDTNPENNRSMFGGGRYDGLVAQFGVDTVPTVGFGMGDVTFMNFLEAHKLLPKLKTTNDVSIIIRDEQSVPGARQAASELREMGVNVAVDYSGRKLDKQMKMAEKSGVRYIVFVGNEEIESSVYTIRDTITAKEQKHSLQRIVSIVKDARK